MVNKAVRETPSTLGKKASVRIATRLTDWLMSALSRSDVSIDSDDSTACNTASGDCCVIKLSCPYFAKTSGTGFVCRHLGKGQPRLGNRATIVCVSGLPVRWFGGLE